MLLLLVLALDFLIWLVQSAMQRAPILTHVLHFIFDLFLILLKNLRLFINENLNPFLLIIFLKLIFVNNNIIVISIIRGVNYFQQRSLLNSYLSWLNLSLANFSLFLLNFLSNKEILIILLNIRRAYILNLEEVS